MLNINGITSAIIEAYPSLLLIYILFMITRSVLMILLAIMQSVYFHIYAYSDVCGDPMKYIMH